jgi:hypothetical protein
MIYDLLIIYFIVLLITFSFIGYGFILANFVDNNLLKFNIGYIGLIGLFFSTLISYFTIFFLSHNYLHNLIFHFIGLLSFFYFLNYNKIFINLRKYLSIYSILFIGLLILRNHDDFNYYHLTYSLGLTENKLILGLGNLGHGYTHHSSIFFLNSLLFLPYIKHFLFHSIGWISLFFVNVIILDELIDKKRIKLNFEFFFYILSFLFINFKFFRIGSYGTDLSGQIIMLCLIPLIYKIYKFNNINNFDKTNFSLVVILITYLTSLKSFMILNFLYLIPLLFFTKIEKIKLILLPRVLLVSLTGMFLLISINISYTGCAIYPVKETCFEKKLEWSLKKDHVENMNQWYQQWSKAGAGINYRVENPKDYIKNLNWISNWYERYFLYKFKETLLGILFLIILVTGLYLYKTKKQNIRFKTSSIRSIKILSFVSVILFLEWFFYHPALRYGGYYLVAILIFIPTSILLSKFNILFSNKKNVTIFLIILSYSLFNIKNFTRIVEEKDIVKDNNFPYFYSPNQEFVSHEIGNDIQLYVPKSSGCWAIKTPCIHHADHVLGDQVGPFKVIKKKN